MPAGSVEVVVAVHDARRPLARCLTSIHTQREALAAAGASLRVRVVAHNLPAEPVIAALPPGLARTVHVLELADGIRSPAGPFNAGLDAADAEFVSTVGSDDVLEPGALAAWYARARETRADAVLAALRRGERVVMTPYLRPGRRRVLDPVADHLAYRTAPLGLLRASTVRRIGFRYTEGGHLNGEDVEPGLRMWFRGGRIAYPYGAPCYRVLEDMGADRATAALGPISRELGFLAPLLAQTWLREARRAERAEIGVKLARAQVVGAIRRRVEASRATRETPRGTEGVVRAPWSADDAAFVSRSLQDLREVAGEGLDALSAAETAVLEGAGIAPGPEELVSAWDRAGRLAGPWRVLPRREIRALSREARPRLFVSQQLSQRSGTFAHPEPPAGWLATAASV